MTKKHLETARRLVRQEFIDAAAQRLLAAERRNAAAREAVQAAEHALEVARRQPERLFRQAIDSGVNDAEIDGIFTAEALVLHRLSLRRRVADHFRDQVTGAQHGLSAARREAWLPVFHHAIALQIAAAEQADIARRVAGARAPDLTEQQAAWDAASEVLALVAANCGLLCNTDLIEFGQPAVIVRHFWRNHAPASAAA